MLKWIVLSPETWLRSPGQHVLFTSLLYSLEGRKCDPSTHFLFDSHDRMGKMMCEDALPTSGAPPPSPFLWRWVPKTALASLVLCGQDTDDLNLDLINYLSFPQQIFFEVGRLTDYVT